MKDGEFYLKANNFFEAIISYNKALRIKPKEKKLLIGLIESYIGIGDKEKAEEKLKEFINLFPNDDKLLSLEAGIKFMEVKIFR